jgi:hypothetical protein
MRGGSREDLRSLFAKKAEQGDGASAIAWALMYLADAQEDTARAIKELAEAAADFKNKSN